MKSVALRYAQKIFGNHHRLYFWWSSAAAVTAYWRDLAVSNNVSVLLKF